MEFVYEVRVTVERTEGRFAGRDEIGEEIQGWITEADQGSVDGIGSDGTSSYEVVDWEVTEQVQTRRRRPRGIQ